jgi:ParB/RepB/Spo0J family partition protein
VTRSERGLLDALAGVESSGWVSGTIRPHLDGLVENDRDGKVRLTQAGRLELMGLRKWREDEAATRILYPGDRFGRLVVLEEVTVALDEYAVCSCDCGTPRYLVRADHLRDGDPPMACGSPMPPCWETQTERTETMNVTTNGNGITGAQRPLYELIALTSIDESPSNPRKTFAEIEELAADIKLRGILQPVLVRPTIGHASSGYELVFGARRYRAARLAGLEHIPAAVREMSDAEALEVQIVENSKRSDIHPLEEADGYRALHETHGYSVEDIAAKVGKSVGFIYGRMKLCALCDDGRAAFLEGRLSPATALLVARIPHAKLQKEAVDSLTHSSMAMSAGQASELIQRRFMLRLAEAPFDRGIADLVPGVVACTDCPKRTGNQKELFADVQSADLCTDPTCFASKCDAAWKLRKAAAKTNKQTVIDGKAAKDLFPYGAQLSGTAASTYVDLDAKCYDDPKNRTYRQILGKEIPTPTLARDPLGGIHELVPRKVAQKALPKPKHDKPSVDPKFDADRKKAAAAREKEQKETEELVAKVVAAAEKREPNDAFWRFVLANTEHGEAITIAIERRGIKIGEGCFEDAAVALVIEKAKLKGPQLRGLFVELLVSGWDRRVLEDAAALYGIGKGPAKAAKADVVHRDVKPAKASPKKAAKR